jgi:hypothetical protein
MRLYYGASPPVAFYNPGASRSNAISAFSAQGVEVDPYPRANYEEHAYQPITSSTIHFANPPAGGDAFFEYIGYEPTTRLYYDGSSARSYARFLQTFGKKIPSFTFGCYDSFVDAIDNYMPGVDGNHLETLSDLRGLLAPLDLLAAVHMFLKTGYKGGLTSFLDFVSDGILTYRFGVSPLVDDTKDLAEKIRGIAEALKHGLYESTLYGKAVFTNLTDEALFSPYTVICRTKVRVKPKADSLLPFILPLKSLGLLPSLSHIWDLVPYSWATDAGFDIGGSLQYLDSSLYKELFEICYTVNSVEVSYDILNEYTSNLFWEGEYGSPAYKIYTRGVLDKLAPSLGPTSLPLIGKPLASFDVYGSILYRRAK